MLDLARELVDLSRAQLAKIPLPDDVRRIAEGAQSITRHVARKRELQYLAKRLRAIDVEPIADALNALKAPGVAETQRLHRLERWREVLLDGSDDDAFTLCSNHPAGDVQQVRQLVRSARTERDRKKSPTASRKLFQVLKAMDQIATLPDI